MAVFNYDEHGSAYGDAYSQRGGVLDRAQRWVSIGGALSSIALVAGLAYWGYALAVRDVTGVPVMRAASGAMRVAPADPGGVQALNQGLTVNAIAAVGTTAKSADTITLAPVAAGLQPDDVPVAVTQSAETPSPALMPALAAPTSAQSDPALAQDPVEAAIAAALQEASFAPTNTPIDPSLRPKPRPIDLGGAVTQTPDLETPALTIAEKDPSTLPIGTILAQFGAYDTPEVARAQYRYLVQNFGALMAGKAMVVQQAETNGRIIYRLRAYGLTSDAEANSFCIAMQSEGAECVPVAQR